MFESETNLTESNPSSTKKRLQRKKYFPTPVTINPQLTRLNNDYSPAAMPSTIPYRIYADPPVYDTNNNNLLHPPCSFGIQENASTHLILSSPSRTPSDLVIPKRIPPSPYFNVSHLTTTDPPTPYFLRSPTNHVIDLNSRHSKTIPLDVHRFVNVARPPIYLVPPMTLPSSIYSNVSEKESISEPTRTKIKRKSKQLDPRTKTQWKHISKRNKMAVMKFLMRKRKQQNETKNSIVQVQSEEKVVENPTNVDLIAPTLKVSFDSNEQIEYISLYYHRKRQDEIQTSDSHQVLKTSENKLDLLLEAVEYIETRKEKTILSLESTK